MGLYDREYYRDEPQGISLTSPRSMVAKLMIVTVAVFVVDAFTPWVRPAGLHWLAEQLALPADVFSRPWMLWKALTYGFAHTSLGGDRWVFHIGFNMLMLFIFGRFVEHQYGPAEFLRFYLASILAGAFAWLASVNLLKTPEGPMPIMVGASGAVTAVVMLYIFRNPKQTLYLWGLFGMPAWIFGVMCVALNVLGALGGEGNVAFEAHLGGAAFAGLYYYAGWNLGRLWPFGGGFSFRLPRPKPRLKVHDPEEHYRKMDEEADRILAKVHREGEDSLTRQERRILEDYSRRMRQKHR